MTAGVRMAVASQRMSWPFLFCLFLKFPGFFKVRTLVMRRRSADRFQTWERSSNGRLLKDMMVLSNDIGYMTGREADQFNR